MAFQLSKSTTAFSGPKKKRQPRRTASSHLEWIRTLPSLVPGTGPVEAAHIRYGEIRYGKRQTGMGERPSDCWVVPLAADQHRKQHTMKERAFWIQADIDPCLVAALLYVHSGDDEAGILIIRNAKLIGRS